MTIIVTGAAGFIGANIVKALNDRGITDIIAVDNMKKAEKFKNLVDLEIADYLDKHDFIERLQAGEFDGNVDAVFHEGACSDTMETDGAYMMENNYRYSLVLLDWCLDQEVQFLYASSAATYGGSKIFRESREFEGPLNVYGYSKFQFDQYLRRHMPKLTSQVVGLRYFNVYGPREAHKGSMASVAFHLNNQIKQSDNLRLFEGCDGYGNGEQRRDFVYVGDVVDVNLWFLDNPEVSGIYNCGTGRSQTFNDVANAVIKYHQRGHIQYIPFPEHLKGCYQSFTEANLDNLHSAGCQHQFKTVEKGVQLYMEWLNS